MSNIGANPIAGLWADVEIFEFEDAVYKSPLRPAPFRST